VHSGANSNLDEFRSFYDRHYDIVLRYVSRRVTETSDVDAIVNEVFAIAWRRFDAVGERGDQKTWLLATARNEVRNYRRGALRLRRLRGRLALFAREASEEEVSHPDPTDDSRAMRAFYRLRTSERDTLALVAWDGLTYEEAAAVSGCSVSAFRVRLHRARDAYRRALEREPVAPRDEAAPSPQPRATSATDGEADIDV